MQKAYVIGALLVLCLFFISYQHNTRVSATQTSPLPEAILKPIQEQKLQDNLKLQDDLSHPSKAPSYSTNQNEASVPTAKKSAGVQRQPFPSISPEKSVEPKEKTLEQLADEKSRLPILDEIKRSTEFNVLQEPEILLMGHLRANSSYQGQSYFLNYNMSFDMADNKINPGGCVALFTSDKVIFRETYGAGNLKFLRPKEEGYSILSVNDKYALQIFQIMIKGRRAFRTFVRSTSETTPMVFTLADGPFSTFGPDCLPPKGTEQAPPETE